MTLAPSRLFQYPLTMTVAIDDIEKRRRGRPATFATPVMVRLQPDQLAQLDAWIATQPAPEPSRPEAVRRLLAQVLA